MHVNYAVNISYYVDIMMLEIMLTITGSGLPTMSYFYKCLLIFCLVKHCDPMRKHDPLGLLSKIDFT